MENDNNRDYGQEARNSSEQLSFARNYVATNQDYSKREDDATEEDHLIPDPDDFDEGDYEDTEDNAQIADADYANNNRSGQDSPEDGRDQNITPDSNSYHPNNNNSNNNQSSNADFYRSTEDDRGNDSPIHSSLASGTNPDRYASVNDNRSHFDTEDSSREDNNGQ